MRATLSPPALQPWQRQLVVVAWVSYAAYYLSRVNLSTAMPAMQLELGFSKSQVGLINSGFFWAYAFSQIINGQLGDRLSPRRFVLVGMLASAGLNLLFGTLSVWWLMMLLWTINGYFQATGWGPILRLLANWLEPTQRRKVSGMFGSCFVAGNALTWLLSGWLVANFGWRFAFWLPALLVISLALVWYGLIRDTPAAAGHTTLPTAELLPARRPANNFAAEVWLNLRRFWSLIGAALFTGFCLVSLIIWIPTYYVEVGQIDIGLAATLSSLLPFAGIGGTLLIGWVVGHQLSGREGFGLSVLLLILAALFSLYAALPFNLVISSAALMLIGGIVYGAGSLVLSTMPLTLGRREEASSIAGLVGFAFNAGGGLSGVIVGAILDAFAWNIVFLTLAASALAGAVFMGLTLLRARK